MLVMVHIDEKWFFLTQVNRNTSKVGSSTTKDVGWKDWNLGVR
ncbi:hypothetical protein H310_02229 [Aphanomyces invadans]|uniref:Uncharacterized protein n=1 Tax=Aphanomyces invadans TaxID=157072 RepID=A0A024UNN3_9STRA|nr:hypothetical protein H310_02229 [Aphanomyces invadans]ETW07800.1 hypothetical protein H310_02229 [Aphanomyces invadans]|eukprot:XP_008863893.1 hypothetical protein H310_02229 [Aphanomyces invadans]